MAIDGVVSVGTFGFQLENPQHPQPQNGSWDCPDAEGDPSSPVPFLGPACQNESTAVQEIPSLQGGHGSC